MLVKLERDVARFALLQHFRNQTSRCYNPPDEQLEASSSLSLIGTVLASVEYASFKHLRYSMFNAFAVTTIIGR